MAIELILLCDVTGKKLIKRGLVEMTTINILFNDVRLRDTSEKNAQGKFIQEKVVFKQTNYAYHICEEHSKDFMKVIDKFFKDKKIELGK